jgi:N-acetylglucosamine malate deacetylase 1
VVAAVGLLAIMAHPDDAELWAGGVLARAAERGDTTQILVATQDPTRAREAELGAAVLGAQCEIVPTLTEEVLDGALASLLPEVVVTHRHNDSHPDHRRAHDLVLGAVPRAVIENGRPLRLYGCDTYNSLTLDGRVRGTVVVDVSEWAERKLEALRAHSSQPVEHFAAMASRMGRYWGGTRGCAWGEAFDPIPVLDRLPAHPDL